MRTNIAPSPSTRASAFVLIVFVRDSVIAGPHLLEGGDVEGPERPVDVALVHAEHAELPREGNRVRRLHRPEAAVATAVVRRAERAAARVGDGAEARGAVRDHHADVATPLALGADAGRCDLGTAPVDERADHLEQLAL